MAHHSAQLSLFFFSCFADHRDLHSFPTRRSSDLLHDMRHNCASHMLAAGRAVPDVAAHLGHSTPQITMAVYAHRSEEHTSELQSQFHLVCRLLLEKKNNKKESVPACSHVSSHGAG